MWRRGRVWVRSVEKGKDLISFLATEFPNFVIEGKSIKERLFFESDIKLILTDAWPCHLPNIVKPARARGKFRMKWRK